MLAQEQTPIQPSENFGALHDRLSELGAKMLVRTLDRLDSGESLQPIQQDESQVTTARKLKSEDYILNFQLPAVEILNRIRAFSPAPGAVAKTGEYSLKILQAELVASEHALQPAQVQLSQDSILIGTADRPLSLKSVKPAGKNAMPVTDYLRGRPTLPDRFD